MWTTSVVSERPLYWVASSKKDLLAMPKPVIREVGMALSVAQRGGKHPAAKPWKGQGPGILEIRSNFENDTFRAVYTVTFKGAVYVLHCFQKKSPSGKQTARTDIRLIGQRLKAASAAYEERYGQEIK
jgi:phage-related protein